MPSSLKGRRAGLSLAEARSKQFFMRSQSGDYLQSSAGTPGGLAVAHKAGKFGNIDIVYPDPYIGVLTLDNGIVKPRFVGVAGELLDDVFATADPNGLGTVDGAGFYQGMLRHIGGGFYCTPLRAGTPAFKIGGVLTFSPFRVFYVPVMFFTDLMNPFLNADGVPAINVAPLGEFVRGQFRFLLTVQHPGDTSGAHPLGPGAFPGMYLFSTSGLDPGAGTALSLPAYPSGASPTFNLHVCPLGRGRAIYMQAFLEADKEPEIRRIESWTTVTVTGHLSDIDPSWPAGTGFGSEVAGNHFTKVGPTHIVFSYNGGAVFAAPPKLFLSVDDGASWTELSLPAGITSSHGIGTGGQFDRPPIECFGAGCFGMAVRASSETRLDYYYTINYGASWAVLPLNGLPRVVRDGVDPDVADILYRLIVLRPYVSAEDKGELAFVVTDHSKPNIPRSLYVTEDLGAHWNFRALIIDSSTAAESDSFGFNDNAEFIGEPLLKRAPILTGLPGALEIA
jgi:hypothetical protein